MAEDKGPAGAGESRATSEISAEWRQISNPGHRGDSTGFPKAFPRMHQSEKAGLVVSRTQWPLAQLHGTTCTGHLELHAMAPPGVVLCI